MTLRRASLMLPCRRLEDFPSNLVGSQAAELLAAWTALWHPSLLHLTRSLSGWHPADDAPDPTQLEGELVLVPSIARQRLATDWCERLRATSPLNPPPVEAAASRAETVAAALAAVSIPADQVASELAADFFALGYAHLQVELLTRAMRYTPVLDDEQFTRAVIAAAGAAVAGDNQRAHDELARAFDLLADARNHVYAVDYYVVDVTLLAESTLGSALKEKLAEHSPTNLLVTGALVERMAEAHPETVAELRRALDAGTVTLVGGRYGAGNADYESPEALLANISQGQTAISRHLNRQCAVFGQFHSSFSPLHVQVLSGLKFKAALHVAFDGGRLPRADQSKTRWGLPEGPSIEALSNTPLDISQPETWLKFAERVGDSLAHDHVATILLAGWPGQTSEYFEDLKHAGRFNAVLGKLVTLEEYFSATRAADDWTSFFPHDYPGSSNPAVNMRAHVDAYRRDVQHVNNQLADGLLSITSSFIKPAALGVDAATAVINAWNFAAAKVVGFDPINFDSHDRSASGKPDEMVPDVPECGYALRTAAISDPNVSLVEGLILRNEAIELAVSETSGGIQSLRSHRDRNTRVSQRLVFHRQRAGYKPRHPLRDGGPLPLETQMVADNVDTTHDWATMAEITAKGRLLDREGQLLARFTQAVRLIRGVPAAIVDIQLDAGRPPEGDGWNCYFASRLAWSDEGAALRRGVGWLGRETSGERIVSPEWVEIVGGENNIVCLAFGLPFHRLASPTWLDTLLITPGSDPCRFQFALALDCAYPTQTALGILTAANAPLANISAENVNQRGWFLHVGAKNLVMTHLSALGGERGIRCRLLETEGRSAATSLTAFRNFKSARRTDFLGNIVEVLSVVGGKVQFDVSPHQWVQLEAGW